MGADRSHEAGNAAARRRLEALVARLDDAGLGRVLDGGRTVAATLAHLAFWDRYALAVLVAWERTGQPPRTGEAEEINVASLPTWLAIPAGEAARSALAAAEAVDGHIERLPETMVAAVVATGRLRTLDRSLHRLDHLREIEGAVGSVGPQGHADGAPAPAP